MKRKSIMSMTGDLKGVPGVENLVKELRTALWIIKDLIDPDSCRFDHHGYCQAHSWFNTHPRCPHARGKDLLCRIRVIQEEKEVQDAERKSECKIGL